MTLLVFLFSRGSGPSVSTPEERILDAVEFRVESDAPGSAVAFRLKKEFQNENRLACFRGECKRILTRWQLLATDPEISSSQVLTVENQSHRWTFKNISLSRAIFEKVNRVALLRLPANVRAKIDAKADLIHFEREYNRKLLRQFSNQIWTTEWLVPLQGKVTSKFAALRTTPSGEVYEHQGLDLRAQIGTPVRASGDGFVIGTDSQVLSGNMITIDHGFGVMSRYLHLSKFVVKVGDRVAAGTIIGYSGASGRVEAPHLHWEMRIQGHPVDPLSTVHLLARLSGPE